MKNKPIIYQLIPRLFANRQDHCIPNGSILQNGSGKMNDITPKVLAAIKELGVNCIWYTGVIEHSHTADYTRYGIPRHNPHVIKGKAGSPYAITDYYDIDPDIAVDVEHRIDEFEALVARTHDADMDVIIDFVPNHVARQYHSDAKPSGIADLGANDDTTLFFGHNNNFYYIPRQLFAPNVDLGSGSDAYVEFPAKATGNDFFSAFPGEYDWYDTVKLNYGVDYGDHSQHFDPIPDTWFKMLHILRYWCGKGVDGFRCDMVHMVPLEFWHWAIANVRQTFPHVKFIAEIYDVGLYRPFIDFGGFDYLYDKVNLYDTLRSVQCHNHSAAMITNCWQTVEGISPQMLNFLENHDEQRFGSPQFAGDPSKAIPSLVVSSMISSGPMMIYMGQEIGEQGLDSEGYSGRDGRTSIFDYWSIETLRRWLKGVESGEETLTGRERWLRDKYKTILTTCNKERAIRTGRFFDLMYVNYDNPSLNPHRQYTFLRSAAGETLVIAVNFGDTSADLRIRIPEHAFEVLNLPQGECMATDILTGNTMRKTFSPDSTFDTFIGAYDAVVWKIKHRSIIDAGTVKNEKVTKSSTSSKSTKEKKSQS